MKAMKCKGCHKPKKKSIGTSEYCWKCIKGWKQNEKNHNKN